ncbi:TPA: SPFH/Band 7/PHB domain protein [bacterium]|nr:SPFH/Band 7/PHB domain protein [bacterium]
MFIAIDPGLVAIIVVVVVVLIIASISVRIVQQSSAVVVQRLGAYSRTLDRGVHFLVPIIDRPIMTISLKEKVADFPPQPVITKDNVTIQIDTVVYYQITDPKSFVYGVDRPLNAIENLTATTLRNIIGDLELDETLTSRDTINAEMRAILDEATDPWRIKVNRVELKNILPPRDIQEAMEKQMRAERERREAILRAEGEKKSAILVAEGEKQSVILRAEAQKEATIAEAEGRAEALRQLYRAQADAIKLINEADPSSAYLALESLKALEKVADGQSTKLIIPSQLQDVTSYASVIAEALKPISKDKK